VRGLDHGSLLALVMAQVSTADQSIADLQPGLGHRPPGPLGTTRAIRSPLLCAGMDLDTRSLAPEAPVSAGEGLGHHRDVFMTETPIHHLTPLLRQGGEYGEPI
jgi:hypothetical protein